MPGRFELYKDHAGNFRFRLKASNGQIILTSEGYKSKAGAKAAIETVRKTSVAADRFERLKSDAGKFTFKLKAGNGHLIGSSSDFSSITARDNAIETVREVAAVAEVEAVCGQLRESEAIDRPPSKTSTAILKQSAERFSDALERLAKR